MREAEGARLPHVADGNLRCWPMKRKKAPKGRPAQHGSGDLRAPGGGYFFNALSNATFDGEKLILRTNSRDSFAPNSLSIPESSHSTDSGPP